MKQTDAQKRGSAGDDSGVAVKNGWPVKPIAEIAQRSLGKMLDKAKNKGTPRPYLRNVNVRWFGFDLSDLLEMPFLDDELARFTAVKGDVLICEGGYPGRAAIWEEDYPIHFQKAIHRVRFNEPERNKWFLYYLHYQEITGQLSKYYTGTGIQHFTGEALARLPVPLPPLPEQRRIVGILDAAFAGIATAKANAERNLRNARGLFESHLEGVFRRRGEGWKMEKLDALTEFTRGHNPPKSKFSRELKPGYVRFYQIRDGGTDNYAVYVPDTPQLHKMKKNDILMVAYRHVGRAFRGVEGAFNVALCKITNARRDVLDDDYLFQMIPSPFVKGELLKRSERSLIPSMSIEHLRELKIPLPPLREQQAIVNLINSISTKTQRLESLYQRKLAALEELKKSLLQRAFSGEL